MEYLNEWRRWVLPSDGFVLGDVWQVALILSVLYLCKRLFQPSVAVASETGPLVWLRRNLGFFVFWLFVGGTFGLGELVFGADLPVFKLMAVLSGLWMAIGLVSSFLRDRFCSDSVAGVLYVVSVFWVFAELQTGIDFLHDFSFQIGSLKVSAWSILAGLFAFIVTLWISLGLARLLENQLQKVPRMSASLKVLVGKIIRIIFIIVATLVALGSVGIDLSALTVLSGAIGLGLGFGLQKVISNFVSGIILLVDNSIKPGDVIEIDGTYGWINNLRARYASVITRDGTEHLIPNEDLITQRVINWSFTNKLVRMKVPFGISYNCDPHQCMELVIEAAKLVDRVLDTPAPVCLLKGFGDNSVDLELRFWISDPSNGVSNVKSKVLLNIWDTFKRNHIEIPFPQRDLHIRSSSVEFVEPVERDES